ncbi:hypothetical protein IGI37_001356 [Enterococcus sp. AZ194]
MTTVVYFVVRFTASSLTTSAMIPVIGAQIVAILFAFFTNKFFVFQNSRVSFRELLSQFVLFVSGRLLTFFLDVVITYIAIETYAVFFIRLLRLETIDYSAPLFSNQFLTLYIGSPERLNEFFFVLLIQALGILLNYFISNNLVFKTNRAVPKKDAI